MSAPDHHKIMHEIVTHFETLAATIEHAIVAFADDERGIVNLAALQRAKDAAHSGAQQARNATSVMRRALD
ncbi:hypothetical protein GCM10022276_28910 [Sphingomonas limnosediminicola]|uniref:Methyl-accepting chemotaxis protein n=1 Tax=Sphingomonas limnosediminicola TaxID=940133 RepID=A0ABP7LUF0_9SPHN